MKKIFSNWHKTVTLFLLPAVLMMLALNIFPLLINYMSTGSFSKKPIILVGAPKSFHDYVNETADANVYTYKDLSYSEFNKFIEAEEKMKELLKGGTVICYFGSDDGDEDISFDDIVSDYYNELAKGNSEATSNAVIFLGHDGESLTGQLRAEQFRRGVLDNYQASLIDRLGGDYANIGSNLFSTDSFNPVTKFMDNRTPADRSASRIVPGMLLIMMYYCVYSLASDMFASEKERGFWAKLIMTPVSSVQIFAGKILAILLIVSGATYLTALLLFFSSWLNTSNDAMSLLPFGMMLTPSELLILIITIPFTVFVMTAACISTIFSLKKMQDITVNLQLPLIFFLGDFFIQMFRGTRPMTLEYFIPMHNSLALISETYMAQEKLWHVIVVLAINAAVAFLVLRVTFKKEGLYDKSK
ncbi:MAG: ABC transporter permease subunit [Saccharofermentans sp.]|nr:ABC transporter permease subunit [Saccharofermentans sp.]